MQNDYVKPAELMSEALAAAERKAALPVRDLLLRGALAGAFLGYATSLVFVVVSQGVAPIVGAILFPVGFVILVLLGLELATGNFAILTQGCLAGRVSGSALARNWTYVYLGNLLGSVFYALLFYAAITSFGATDGGPLGELVRQAAQKKTLVYAALGARGWATAFVKAILCNWMVTLGTMMAFVSRSTTGKIVAMWLPILTFFAHGYEHSIVNMFVIPAGMLLKAPVSPATWWVWNQVPVTLGNILGGAVLTALALHLTYHPREAPIAESQAVLLPAAGVPLTPEKSIG
jgi:formate transporter